MENPYKAYAGEEEITDKGELLLEAYKRMIENLKLAKSAMEEGNVKLKAEILSKVTSAIAVLQASLDFEKGGEIAENLNKLYDFCMLELVKANARNETERIDNVIDIISTILDGFKNALKEKK